MDATLAARLVPLGLALVGCSASGAGRQGGAGGASGASGSGATGGVGGVGGVGAAGAGGSVTTDGGAEPAGQVFGHSATTLYELDPTTKQVKIIGNFDCLGGANTALNGGMWDIAVDKNGNMVGVVFDGLLTHHTVTIDAVTAHCTQVTAGTFPNSLTFVPAGTVLPNDEALVGYDRDVYVLIDTATAQATPIGNLNPGPSGEMFESSGDIVSIIGGKTYLTVRPLGTIGSNANDVIVEVNPTTGQMLKVIGATGFSDLWGLGFWAGTAYGFSAHGQLAAIDLNTGAGTPVPLSNVPPGLAFWGAGVTTAAPIEPPK